MRKQKHMTPVELHAAGVRALIDELGVSGMLRFIGFYYKGEGDFTRDRRLRPEEPLDKIVARIKKRRAAKKKKAAARSRK